MKGINTIKDKGDTRGSISLSQGLVNKINAKVEFTHRNSNLIKGIPTRLHRSKNPSLKYDNVQKDVAGHIVEADSALLGVLHLDGTYEVLEYLPVDYKETKR